MLLSIYGNVLWKSIALPSLNYASSVCFSGSKADIDKIENLQLQMARFIFKAPRYTPRATLYGDLGWVPISTLHDISRTKYFARVANLDSHRWPKLPKLLTMLSLNVEPENLRYKFVHNLSNILRNCNIRNIVGCTKMDRVPDNPNWIYLIKRTYMIISILNGILISILNPHLLTIVVLRDPQPIIFIKKY